MPIPTGIVAMPATRAIINTSNINIVISFRFYDANFPLSRRFCHLLCGLYHDGLKNWKLTVFCAVSSRPDSGQTGYFGLDCLRMTTK